MAGFTSSIVFLSSGLQSWYPQRDCGHQGKHPAEHDGNLQGLSPRFLIIFDGEFECQETVKIDEEEVVDGGTEQDDFHARHHVTEPVAKFPPTEGFI